jgi:hypothetical protein
MGTHLGERQDAFRAGAARLVQAMRHYLQAGEAQPEVAALLEPVQHLASLLAAGCASAGSCAGGG